MATAHPRLGELLLARGTCTRAQLLEAWEQKVLYGDRLGTNLLALGHIDEATLAKTLGGQHGVHSGHGKVLRVDKEAVKLLPRALAERHFVVPHHVADRSLFLLMRDPHDAHAIDDVRFKTGLKVVPVAVCEARVWQLLDVHYQSRVSLRPVALERPRKEQPFSEPERTNPASLGPELVSEEDFQRLYAGMHSGAVPVSSPSDLDDITSAFGTQKAAADDVFAPPKARGPGQADVMTVPPRTADAEVSEWRERVEHTNPLYVRPDLSDEAAGDAAPAGAGATTQATAGEPYALIDEADVENTVPFPERQQTLDFQIEVGAFVDESPLSFDEATRILKAAADRDAIGRIVLRAARSKFKRACLLTVFPDRIVGWLGIGEGFEQDRMRDISIPRAEQSVFGLVATSRSHYLGPLQRWPQHGAWVKATGRKIPSSLAVFPILVRGRAVNLLVVDNGHGEHVGSDVGEALILAQQIAGTYESLLKPA